MSEDQLTVFEQEFAQQFKDYLLTNIRLMDESKPFDHEDSRARRAAVVAYGNQVGILETRQQHIINMIKAEVSAMEKPQGNSEVTS